MADSDASAAPTGAAGLGARVALALVGIALGALFGSAGSGSGGAAWGARPERFDRVPVALGIPPLRATLTVPSGARQVPAVVLVSGSGPNDQDETVGADKPFVDLADGLARQGVATLRYDKRTRDYPADVDPSTFTPVDEYVPDAVAAVTFLEHRRGIDPHRVFVLGHSQGGTFAPLIAKTDPSVAGVILMAAAAEPFGTDLVRQVSYLADLPGSIGSSARSELPQVRQAAQETEQPELGTEGPDTTLSPLLGGTGPVYWRSLAAYDEVATARALPQPLLFHQGGRDYQVTVPDDLSVWLKGLKGRPDVTVHVYPDADHLFIDGTGTPSPADYNRPGHLSTAVIADIARWVRAQPPR